MAKHLMNLKVEIRDDVKGNKWLSGEMQQTITKDLEVTPKSSSKSSLIIYQKIVYHSILLRFQVGQIVKKTYYE